MDNDSMLQSILGVLREPLFEIGGRPVTAVTIVIVAAIMVGAWVLSRLTQRAIRRASEIRGVKDEGNVAVINRLVHFVFLFVAFGISVEAVGFDLAALFAAGAVFAVALGFAVQNIVQSFVSGVILLGERSIKPGDVLEVEGQIVKVRRIGIRATVVRTLSDEDLIVPNSNMVQSMVKNFTHSDNICRLRVPVGVVYSSDMDQVQETLEKAAEAIPWRVKDRAPIVLMTAFGSSSVDFEVSLWIDDPWTIRRRSSDLHRAVWKALKAEEIVIAFPQLDVHFDPEVASGLARRAA